MLNLIHMNIAGYSISLYSESVMVPDAGYLSFIEKTAKRSADLTIHSFTGIQAPEFREADLVFEAEDKTQKYYRIYRACNGWGFMFYRWQGNKLLQQKAFLDSSCSHWKVYSDSLSDETLWPLKYPFGSVVMYYLTLKSDAVMIHASGISDAGRGLIFAGFSGTGKTTISGIWAKTGRQVINDDRLIIRKCGKDYFICNLPSHYRDIPKQAALHSVFLISHSGENRIKRLSGAIAISKVLACSIQMNFDRESIQHNLNFISELCSQIPVCELEFVPDQSVVNFIQLNEKERI